MVAINRSTDPLGTLADAAYEVTTDKSLARYELTEQNGQRRLSSYDQPTSDAASPWQSDYDYIGAQNEIFEATVGVASAVDINSTPLTNGSTYLLKYPTDQTSGSSLDLAEFAKMELVSGVTTSSGDAIQALTHGATVAWNVNSGASATLDTNNTTDPTISAPSNVTTGKGYSLTIRNSSVSDRTITFDNAYRDASDSALGTAIVPASQSRSFQFIGIPSGNMMVSDSGTIKYDISVGGSGTAYPSTVNRGGSVAILPNDGEEILTSSAGTIHNGVVYIDNVTSDLLVTVTTGALP